MTDILRRAGEVIEAGTTDFVAQCYELYQSPPLGSLVKTVDESVEQYGIVYNATTASIEPGRRPIARGKDEASEEELYRASPQLEKLLRSEFSTLVVGHRQDDKLYHYLPPKPARIHAFVYRCSPEEVREFSDQPVNILDVGGGPGTIAKFISPKRYRVCVLDARAEALRIIEGSVLEVVVGDGCNLPFKDNSFDVVTSVDCLEHIPDDRKASYCRELKRVARRLVVIHCPADSADGTFDGTVYDIKFLKWYRSHLGKDEQNTLEHLRCGLPNVERLLTIFPEAKLVGKQNCETWLRYMKLRRVLQTKLLTGLIYRLLLERKDDLPPYHSCLLVWRKA